MDHFYTIDSKSSLSKSRGYFIFKMQTALSFLKKQKMLETLFMMGMKYYGVNSTLILSAGPLRSATADIHCRDWRVRAAGDVGGWGAHGGSKEARVTLKHTVQGQPSPALQVRITYTQNSHNFSPLC